MLIKKIYVILVLLLYSCQEHKNIESIKNMSIQKNVVIILKNRQNGIPIIFRKINSIDSPDGNIITSIKNHDTLSIPIKEYDILLISNKLVYKDTLLVKWGDTINMILDSNKIIYNSKVFLNPFSKYKYNFDIKVIENEINNISKRYFSVDTINTLNLSIKNEYERIKKSGRLLINRKLIKKEEDSIIKLTDLYFKLYDKKRKYYLSQQKKGVLFSTETKLYLDESLYYTYNNLYKVYKYTGVDYVRNKLISSKIINETLLKSNFSFNILNQYLTLIKGKNTQDKKNFTELFFLLPQYVSGKLLEVTRVLCLNQMINWGEPFKNVLRCYDNYKNIHGNNSLIEGFEKKYLLELKSLNRLSKDLILYQKSKEQITLSEFILNHKGKVIYIDLWASWCAPCRISMPFSEKLKNEFKDVIFLYLSIDKDKEKWVKASNEEGIIFDKNNFLVLNFETAKYSHDLKISTIPRYLLYNKHGILVHQTAPKPESDNIKSLLYKYVLE